MSELLIKLIELVNKNELTKDCFFSQPMGVQQYWAQLMMENIYISSKNNYIYWAPNIQNPACNIINIQIGRWNFNDYTLENDKTPDLFVTDYGNQFYENYITSKEMQKKPLIQFNKDVDVTAGGVYVDGDVENSRISTNNKKSFKQWCKSNKICIGSITLNVLFLIKIVFFS